MPARREALILLCAKAAYRADRELHPVHKGTGIRVDEWDDLGWEEQERWTLVASSVIRCIEFNLGTGPLA
jgi:hypothetical protein